MKIDPPEASTPAPVEVGIGIVLREPLGMPPGSGGSAPNDYQILITRRNADAIYGGYWEFPGGKVEAGESPEAAAAREVREEIGCLIEPVAALPLIEHTYEHARVRLHAVVCRLSADSPPPRNLHVADHRWCALGELPWEEFLPANVRLITALVRWLEEQSGKVAEWQSGKVED